jgi:hypothetical protein
MCIDDKNCVLSRKEITSLEDTWFRKMESVLERIESWRREVNQIFKEDSLRRDKRFLTEELYFDLLVNCSSLIRLAKKSINFRIPFVPRNITQDPVENWFSLQRTNGGVDRNLTAAKYRNISAQLMTFLQETTPSQKITIEKHRFPMQPLKRKQQKRRISRDGTESSKAGKLDRFYY